MSEEDREVLNLVFAEKNSVLHTIRARVLSVQFWYCGGILALSGWTATELDPMPWHVNALLAVGVVLAATVVVYGVMNDERGFNHNRKILGDAEEALGLYDVGRFLKPGKSLYPGSWRTTSGPHKKGRFFRGVYLAIGAFTAFGVVVQLGVACGWFSMSA